MTACTRFELLFCFCPTMHETGLATDVNTTDTNNSDGSCTHTSTLSDSTWFLILYLCIYMLVIGTMIYIAKTRGQEIKLLDICYAFIHKLQLKFSEIQLIINLAENPEKFDKLKKKVPHARIKSDMFDNYIDDIKLAIIELVDNITDSLKKRLKKLVEKRIDKKQVVEKDVDIVYHGGNNGVCISFVYRILFFLALF